MSNQQEEIQENYGCQNCAAEPINSTGDSLQNLYSPCTECSSIYNARKIRTAYDQFWLKFYNNKAQNTATDLMDLQFAA
jgi:hypothetical protein